LKRKIQIGSFILFLIEDKSREQTGKYGPDKPTAA
jgi:hypothetical protein